MTKAGPIRVKLRTELGGGEGPLGLALQQAGSDGGKWILVVFRAAGASLTCCLTFGLFVVWARSVVQRPTG